MMPMTPSEKLHVFARRYCMDRHDFWATKYAKLARSGNDRRGSAYTEKAYSIFPRYNVISAILREVEILNYNDLPDLEELYEALISTGERANTFFTEGFENETAISVMEFERQIFIDEIGEAVKRGLGFIDPLFYRRVLTEIESKEIWKQIEHHWGADGGYWYPLSEKTHPSLIAINVEPKNQSIIKEKILSFLKRRKITQVFELREFDGGDFLIDAAAADFQYTGDEGYWVSDAMDWIIYCSHEWTITFGGEAAVIKNQLYGSG